MHPVTAGDISSTSSKQKVFRTLVRLILRFTSLSPFYSFLNIAMIHATLDAFHESPFELKKSYS